jgi:hypothetical protein
MILKGKFDGKQVILDEVPKDLPANSAVMVFIEPAIKPSGLDAIIGIAGDADLPSDFAAQHEHYTKGTPKR